jgi:hypothetical protein
MRCRQPLAKGSGFCLSCGFQNDADDFVNRQLKIEEKLEGRSALFRFLRTIFAAVGLTRRL